MASLNQASVIGFVGDAPRISTTRSGQKVASFTVATTDRGYTRQNGEVVPDRTEWHNVVAWGKVAEVVEKYVRKGSSVFVQGKMRTRSYTAKDGTTKYVTEIDTETLQMLDRKQDAQSPVQQQPQAQQAAPTGGAVDLPF